MSKSTLILSELEYALQYWEDTNLHMEVFFQCLKAKQAEFSGYTGPFVGSEVNNQGLIQRAIKNYPGFRKMLENNISVDSLQFLPRVPKDLRGNYSQLDFMRFFCLTTITSLPYMLHKWLETKKVFSMEQPEAIPLVSLSEENYFDKLPYDSFIIRFDEPILSKRIHKNIFLEDGPPEESETSYKLTMVTSDGKTIDFICVPESLERMCLDNEQRNTFKSYWTSGRINNKLLQRISGVKFDSFVQGFGGFSIDIETGMPIIKRFNEKGVEKTILCDFYRDEPTALDKNGKMTEEEIINSVKDLGAPVLSRMMLELINGFCKLMAELPPKQILSMDSSTEHESTRLQPREFSWHSVPITEVRSLSNGEIATIFRKGGNGAEKSPHWRKAHWRKLRDQNGVVFSKIWIEKVLVREDKLEEENLKGSATILKNDE